MYMENIFSKSRGKLGVTVAMVVTMVTIIALITTTVVISVRYTVKSSRLKAFATELYLVQNTVTEASFSGSVNEFISDDITVAIKNAEQFSGENMSNNTLLLHVLDLSKLGTDKSVYGNGKSENDYYALSTDTMKVYYVAGYDAGDKIYYTLTDDLIEVIRGYKISTLPTDSVIFKANYIDWTNQPIQVTVRVPKAIDISTVTVDVDNENILKSSSFSLDSKGEYNELVVNTGNVAGNYIITVKYTKNGGENKQIYSVSNYDGEKPTVVIGKIFEDDNGWYIDGISAADNGRIKKLKFIDLPIEQDKVKKFFETGGYDVKDRKVRIASEDTKFTVYAEDFAGNYTTDVDIVTIPREFYYVGGTKDTGVVISDNAKDKAKGVNANLKGNQFVWVPVEGYTMSGEVDSNGLYTSFKNVFKRGTAVATTDTDGNTVYKMTGTLRSNFTEPYANGYETETTEYNAMMLAVQKYNGFYIARFEAGDGDATVKRTKVTTAHTVVSKKNAYVYNYVPWGKSMSDTSAQTLSGVDNVAGAVELSKNMYKDSESVVSTLCYGVQWDAVMNFVSDKEHNIKDSRSWGNYSDSTGGAATNSGSSNMNYITGRNEAWKAKNIYDLAGNVAEWTVESYSSNHRVYRGGGCFHDGSGVPAGYRYNGSIPTTASYSIGFRATLYIKDEINVPIPDGFYYVGGTKETGVVISDAAEDENKGVDYTCVGNQFVWIPVQYTLTAGETPDAITGLYPSFTSVFKRGAVEETASGSGIYKMTGALGSEYTEPFSDGYATEKAEYDAMMLSVQKHHGFYIARFEAGDGDATSRRIRETVAHTVVSKKNAYVYNYVPWGNTTTDPSNSDTSNVKNVAGAVVLSKNMYKGSNSVVSTLCYGVQWDAVMNFVSDADHNIKDSVLWGNYKNSKGDAAADSGSIQVCGKNEAWKAKNIYDLAGNVSEFTMEALWNVVSSSVSRPYRGGSSANLGVTWSASTRSVDNLSGIYDDVGFRPALYIKDKIDRGVPIPDGFYYVGGTKNTGLVISDAVADENKGVDYTCVGNQFVWVPVEYTATGITDANGLDTGFTDVFKRGIAKETPTGSGIYKMTGVFSSAYSEPFAGGYSDGSGTEEKAEYVKMMLSVQKNKGFYIGRFEAGDGDATSRRTAKTEAHTVVSKKNVYVYDYVPWGDDINKIGTTGAVYLSQSMYKDNPSVVSTLCYGVQWDATLNFVSDTEHNIVDSASWGNYNSSTGDAATNSGSSNMNYTTGRNEAWKAKNIYDLAGNIGEWTMETISSYYSNSIINRRVWRGVTYIYSSSKVPADSRNERLPTSASEGVGFRVTLYIK